MHVCDDDATTRLAPLVEEPDQLGADAIRQVVEEAGAIDDVVGLRIGRNLDGLAQQLLHGLKNVGDLGCVGAAASDGLDLLLGVGERLGIEVEQIEREAMAAAFFDMKSCSSCTGPQPTLRTRTLLLLNAASSAAFSSIFSSM